MSGPFTKRHLSRTTVQTYTTTTQGPVLGAGKAVPESDLEFRRLKDNFASLRLGVRAAVTVPSSVRYRVSRERPESNMARPRSPQKKNDVDHEQMQLLLDQQLSDIRQQLNQLSSERAKMEQKMEDLVNGIKEARIQSSRMVPLSQPGAIRRAHSVETRPNVRRTNHRRQKSKNETFTPTPEDVVGEEAAAAAEAPAGQHASSSSLASSLEHRDSDAASLSDSMNSSLFSSVGSLIVPVVLRKDSKSRLSSVHVHRPVSFSDGLDRTLSPTPIPELPESPGYCHSSTPKFFTIYSPRLQQQSYSSAGHYSPRNHSSKLRSTPCLVDSTNESSAICSSQASRSSPALRKGSSPALRKMSQSTSDMMHRGSLGSSTSISSPSRKKDFQIQQSNKDRQLSFFRQNTLNCGSLKEIPLSGTDDECESRDSIDTLSQGSSPTDSDTISKAGSSGKSLILRRSSLTGQIEHVTNLRAQVRRNSSFNGPIESLNAPLHGRWPIMSSSQGSLKGVGRTASKSRQSVCIPNVTRATTRSRVIILDSRETTV